MRKWGGHRARQWKLAVLGTYGHTCWLNLPGCTVRATTGDHVIPRSVRPDLQYEVSNGRPACEPCNKKRGAKPAPPRQRVDARAWFRRSA